ncbi:MAG: hypothetical protein EXS67_03920 [Candidatus Margulisbacteria bacterium]|nr:hypothetical protein [Candidatus Margulisiibacteriota bacterium]
MKNRILLSILALLFVGVMTANAAESYLDSQTLIVHDSGLVYKLGKVGIGTANPVASFNIAVSTQFDSNIGFQEIRTTSNVTPTTLNWNKGNKQRLAISSSGTTVLIFTNPTPVSMACHLQLMLTYTHASGITGITWPASVKWPGGAAPLLSKTQNTLDIVDFFYINGTYYGVTAFDFR